MPIVGDDLTKVTISGDVNDWSHSGIFSTNASTYQTESLPDLTMLWTPQVGCYNRWMANLLTAVGTITSIASRDSLETSELSELTAMLTAISPALLRRATTDPTFHPVITTPATERGIQYLGTFVAFSTYPSYTGLDTYYDASYIACQPFGVQQHYSPGICPSGQTVAEITEYHYPTTSASTATRFEASCCQR
jgi:hypothetical protein